jgi:hypothetical protein
MALLPVTQGAGTTRYVVGPGGITTADVASASVQKLNGNPVMTLRFTPAEATKWDDLTQQQFHA